MSNGLLREFRAGNRNHQAWDGGIPRNPSPVSSLGIHADSDISVSWLNQPRPSQRAPDGGSDALGVEIVM
jgi:hypothetical protein